MNKKIFIYGCAALALAACSNDNFTDIPEYNNPGVNSGIQPMYEGEGNQMDDYYIDVSAWNQRSQWNLANTHDPSVMLADDGYYYMYQTDASYGNAHDGEGQFRGHFYCRRSKDLVNWQFMGPTMRHIPSWVGDSINSIRLSLGLDSTEINFASGDPTDMGYWAPCARKVEVNGQTIYRMYYSFDMPAVESNTNDKMTEKNFSPNMMGLMETTDPSDLSSWVDKGFVITQYSDKAKSKSAFVGQSVWGGYFKFNVIDPTYIVVPDDAQDGHAGEHWLIYGSWHSGIAAVQVDPETGKPYKDVSNPWCPAANFGQLIYKRFNSRWQASEGPEIIYRNGYYYLFLANNGLDVPYCTTIVRAKSITGPYYDIAGTNFTSTGASSTSYYTDNSCAYPIETFPYKFGDDHGWVGIGHCAIFDDGNDNWYYCSQQRFPNGYDGNAASNAIMMGGVRSIVWVADPTTNSHSGGEWPMVLPERYAAVAQTAITEEELVGAWQNIKLVYNYKDKACTNIQDGSTNFNLNAGGTTTSCPISGTWSFDPSTNIITFSSGIKLYVRREQDWEMEAGTRVPTLVYVGLSTDGKTTFWGKKKTVDQATE